MVCGATANNSTAGNATFTNCTFNSDEEKKYGVWVSGNNATFIECTFQGYRGLKMHEAYGSEITSVTVDACTFDNLSKKPGVAIGTLNAETTVTIKNSVFHNCQAGDRELYIYETDTDVTTFSFSASENNTVINDNQADNLTIKNVATLKAFAAAVNNGTSYSGKTVTLDADLDLNNVAWTPIGDCTSSKYFQGTFDGQNHTISNLYVDDSANTSQFGHAGLFGWVDAAGATIKNVKVDNATVKGSHWVGVIAGYFSGTLENCTVSNSIVEGVHVNVDADGDKVGGIVGYLNKGSLNNNTVSKTTIKGNRDVGGIAGAVVASPEKMENNKVSNVTITYITPKDYASAGVFVSGRTGYTPDETNTSENVTVAASVSSETSIETLNAALAAGGDVTLTSNINPTGAVYVKGGTINGNGYTLNASKVNTSAWPNAYAVTLGNGGSKVENLKVVSAGYAIGSTATTEDVYIDNVTTDYVTYAINGNGENSVYVTNSTINGWNSYSNIKLFSFDNCKLAKANSGDGYLVIYGETIFKDCTFEDFHMCARKQDGAVCAKGKTVTFTNCSYNTANGTVKVTAENFKSLFMETGDEEDFNHLKECEVIIDGTKVTLE